ncbi:MAG: SHOCT domain-containing protein [Balneolales bacterium]
MRIVNPAFLQVDQIMDNWEWSMILMIIFWVLMLLLLVTMIWFLVRKGGDTGKSSSNESALDILHKRYARGEIDDEHYRRMKKELAGRE